jgi:hypothetical protein
MAVRLCPMTVLFSIKIASSIDWAANFLLTAHYTIVHNASQTSSIRIHEHPLFAFNPITLLLQFIPSVVLRSNHTPAGLINSLAIYVFTLPRIPQGSRTSPSGAHPP